MHALSNDGIADDLPWVTLVTTQNYIAPNFKFWAYLQIFETGEYRHFKFDRQIDQ